MDQPFRITTKLEFDGEIVNITGEIPSKDWATLLRFRDEANSLLEDLKKCENLNVNFTLQWNHTAGLSLEADKTIKSQDLAIVLHRLRPFILNDEPFAFNRTVNLLQRYVQHELMVKHFRFLKNWFGGKVFQSQVQITSGEWLVNCEKMLMTWLNACEYHRDDDKRRLIEEVDASLPAGFSRLVFTGMINDKVKAVAAFAGVISSFELVAE